MVGPISIQNRKNISKQLIEQYQQIQELISGLQKNNTDLNSQNQMIRDAVARIDQQLATIGSKVAQIDTLQTSYSVMLDNQAVMLNQQKDLLAALSARKVPVPLPNVIIPAAQLVSLLATSKVFSDLPCTGIKTTDKLYLTPVNLPTGYGLRGYTITKNDFVNITLWIPILSAGGSAITFAAETYR